jgi:hypothetical protein
MTLRVGVDMDGVLADFAGAFRAIEHELFGVEDAVPEPDAQPSEPVDPSRAEAAAVAPAAAGGSGAQGATSGTSDHRAAAARERERRVQAVWQRIRATENFWATLKPLDAGAVRRLHALMLQYRWDVFFITQRPATAGDTVQRQTQRWLVQQGFDWPSVLVIAGSRGAAAGALRLTHHVDDSPRNCLDVRSDSEAAPILIVPALDDPAARHAQKLGLGVAVSFNDALDFLERVSAGHDRRGVLGRIASFVTGKR